MRILFYLFCFFSLISATTSVPLSLSSIHEEMDRIFKGHVSKKEVTPETIQEAIKLYIRQFDPNCVYLLDSEVAPFFNLTEIEKKQALIEYKQDRYSLFIRCNSMIQKAIEKMRTFRKALVVRQEVFYDLAALPINTKANTPTGYFESKDTLLSRQASNMAQLVFKEIATSRKIQREMPFKEAVRVVELEIEEDENGYLFIDRLGKPIDAKTRDELLAFHILKALTATLDAHTRYLNPHEAADLRMKLEKNYVGVGIRLQELGRAFVVESIVKGSSADTTGVIKVGDELLEIDNAPIKPLTLAMAQNRLEGEANTSISLKLQRRSSDGLYMVPISITLQRRDITILEGRVDTTFEKSGDGIIGIIALHAFYQGEGRVTSEYDVQKALDLLQEKGPVKGIILDLRDNKGGFLMQAVKVAGMFIKSGVIVAAKYSNGELHYFRDLDATVRYSGPLIVLISKETASAAEIVAEALKDYGVALIVGDTKTFGKGSIQLQTVTKGKNEESYFKVTVGRYYGVSGKSTQLDGVKADIVVPGINSLRKFGEEYLAGALKGDSIAPVFKDPLTDISESERKWFQKYYIPYVQPQVMLYRKWIPDLAKLSQERIAKNKNYSRLIHGERSIIERKGLTDTTVELDQEELKRTFSAFQLQEATNIMKDVIRLAGNR